MRQTLLLKKIGMTQIPFCDEFIPVTVLKYVKNRVIATKTEEKCGYNSVVLGFDELINGKEKKLSKPEYCALKKFGFGYFNRIIEVRCSSQDEFLTPGSSLELSVFKKDQLIDVVGKSKGKGFAGAVKRYGFGGGRATHGNSLSHRVLGSTGNRADPGRVFKNKKMAGHMGSTRVTIQNLKVFDIDPDSGLLFVRGAVPGCNGAYVIVRDAIKS